MTPYIGIEWAGTALSLTGALAVAFRKTWGMWAFMIADGFLGLVAYHAHLYGLITLYAAFAVINVVGIVNWSKS